MVINSSNVSMTSKSSYQIKRRVTENERRISGFQLHGKEIETEKDPQLENKKGDRVVQNETMRYLFELLFKRIFGADSELSGIFDDFQDRIVSTQIKGTRVVESEQKESVEFKSQGTAITADGRELNFDYSFSMSSEFKEYYEENYEFTYNRRLIDPLVINLDCNPTKLSDQKFEFDLDCDGRKDEICRLDISSGYLVFDKDNDGKVKDGSELFGTKTGDGFKELALYDEDNNGWIDENDSIFERLRIWTIDEKGNSVLHKLKEMDVGAIYLESVRTKYEDRDSKNGLNAVIQKSGIYLHESTGLAGSIQHVDMAT